MGISIYAPRYRPCDARTILDLSVMKLRAVQHKQPDDGGWRLYSLMDIFRLMLARELNLYGVDVGTASLIAHETPIGICENLNAELSFLEQFSHELFGKLLIVQRHEDGWSAVLEHFDRDPVTFGILVNEDKPLIDPIGVVIPLLPFSRRLIDRLRLLSLGE